ncbi:MAG TPA: glycosyltransferase family 2 protein [Solirubrobacterales bacterium]|nr:glycosyltransferase family 2 protein [Solirubrobacterales bacterium]
MPSDTNLGHLGLHLVVNDREAGICEGLSTVSPLAAQFLPEWLCRRYNVIAISFEDDALTVATGNPYDISTQEAVAAATSHKVRWVTADPEEVAQTVEAVFNDPGAQAVPHDGVMLDTGSLLELGLAVPPRLGDMLAAEGLVTEDQIREAVEEQQRTGDRIGEVLVGSGAIGQDSLLNALSQRLRIPLVDLSEFDAAQAPRDLIPEPVCRELDCVPIAEGEEALFVAVSDPLGEDALMTIREYTDLPIRTFLASPNGIDELLHAIYHEEYTENALSWLINEMPEVSARWTVTGAQKAVFTFTAIAILALIVIFPLQTFIGLCAAATILYTITSLFKIIVGYSSLEQKNEEVPIQPVDISNLDERTLPMYTILIPLYREAAVIPQLAAGIEGLDYPRTKLDVRLLCEEDDDETIDAIRALDLKPHFKLVIVPDSLPKTKPKACNYGLAGAEGELVTIYDAEDRPMPDQLKKAVIMFRQGGEELACVQARLNYFNQDQNLLTRWFSIEYAMLFDLVLPGLDRRKDPIPLGGTSNHLRRDRLLEVGGWDPFNVTEDAELGLRLHRAGYRTAMMDSVTLEEANSQLDNWVRQRSRWIKGYIQTWLVSVRHPVRLMNEFGFNGFLAIQVMIGGTFIFLINPIFWTLTTVFFLTKLGIISDIFPSYVYYVAAAQLFLGNFVFLYLGVIAAARRGDDDLAKYALLSPLYWGLMSLAAWKGFIQLFTNPFYWEKTTHGLDHGAGQGTASAP